MSVRRRLARCERVRPLGRGSWFGCLRGEQTPDMVASGKVEHRQSGSQWRGRRAISRLARPWRAGLRVGSLARAGLRRRFQRASDEAVRPYGFGGRWEGGLAHGLCSSQHADAPSSAAPPTTACGPHRHCCREPFDSRHASWPQPRTSPPPACRMTCAAHRVDPAGNQSGDELVRAGRAPVH